jgi:uncharacterized protein
MKQLIAVLVLSLMSQQLLSQEKSIAPAQAGYYKNARMHPVSMRDVKITDGFWRERMDVNTRASIPYLLELAADTTKGHVIKNFEIAAGLATGQRKGTNWQDAWLYKWIESACYALVDNPDEKLESQIDGFVEIISRAQADDGYLATQTMITSVNRFEAPVVHEFYTMGHLITAGVVHYQVTGKTGLLQVAEKCATFLYDATKGKAEEFSEYPFNPSVIMAAVDLYRVTNNKKYLELADFLVTLRGYKYATNKSRPFWGPELEAASDQNQNFKPLRIEDEVLGHAVFFTYLYAGASDVYMETGDEELLIALERLWKDLVTTKMYVTGGIGPEHKALVSRKTGENKRDIVIGDPIHEGISGPFDLPNSTAYNETCGQVGNFMWNWRMLQITGNPKYADLMERSIYNSILSGVELDGTGWYYTNPLRWNGPEHILLNKDAHKRYDPGLSDICCPTNLTRTVASYSSYLYSVFEKTIWVHHYANSDLSTDIPGYGKIQISQTTNYPWNGEIILDISRAVKKKELVLNLRIPEWATGAKIAVNNEVFNAENGTYFTLKRSWNKGDQIRIELPLEVKKVIADSKFEHLTNQVSIMRGPLVFCLESIDIEDNASIEGIHVPLNTEWTLLTGDGALKNMSVLEASVMHIEPIDNSGTPYKVVDELTSRPVKIRLIPYFAWNNRDEPKMRVWLPIYHR